MSTSDGIPAYQASSGEHTVPSGPPVAGASATTRMGTPATVVLIADPHDAQTGARVVTGYSQPAHGQVTLIGPRAIYTPTPGYAGSDSFRYTITDASGQSTTGTAQLEVAAAIAFCSITITAPSPAMIGPAIHLTATASCNTGTPEIQWQHRLGTSGTFATFKNFSTATSADFTTTGQPLGTHQFRARVRAQGTTTTFTSNTATTSLVANTTPCTAVTLDTPAAGAVFGVGQAVTLHASATCPAGVVPEFQYLAMQPTDTGFTTLPGTFPGGTSYTPPQAGTWLLMAGVRASGASGAFLPSAAVTVAISHVPVAVDDALVLDQDATGTINVLTNDADPDGDPLTATITTPASAGTASISAGVITYHPASGYHGSDLIGYTVSDGRGNTATATVHVTVNRLDNPPSAHHDFLTVAENTSGSIDVSANDTDPDGDTLSVVGFSQPSNGTASFTGNVATYTPGADFVGSDEFEYTISDGHGKTSTASVFITVTAVNDPPIASDDTLVTPEDTEGGVDLLGNDSDPDGDPLTIVSFTQPGHGTVAVVAGLASYIPAPDYNGPDAFSYTVADPSGLTSTATVHVTVVPVNDPPVALDDSASLDEDTTATIDVVANDSDVDHDVLTVTAVTQPAHGTAAVVSGHEVTYTPAPDYNGADSFTYTVADPSGATATATVTVAIDPVNDPPVATADAIRLDEDTSAMIDVVANDGDVDHDALTVTAVTQPAHGTAAIVDATHVRYTPAPDYNGLDSFSYTISDGNGGEAGAEVSVTVNPVNDPPVANADVATLDEDIVATIDVVANDSDVDHDALTVTAITQPANGTVAIVDATHVRYTPAPDYNGPDSFGYTISDPSGATATATVTLTIDPVNDPPVALPDAATALEDGSVTIDVAANDSDVDHDPLTLAAITQPVHGTATIVDAHHVSYTPAPRFHATDTFSYTIGDPSGATATATVTVSVTHVNHAPTANDDAASLDEDTAVTVDVVANDLDGDGDALTITAITQPAYGVAMISDAHHVQYIPAPDYNGPDALSYTISDGAGGTSTAQLALTVNPVNDPPVAVNDAMTLDEDTTASLDVVANDSDVDHDTLAVVSVTPPAHGTAAITGLHQVSYTPAGNYNGTDGFSYTVDDGHGGQATAQVAVTINPVNDPPVAVNDAMALDEDTTATADVIANDSDVDGDALTVSAVTQPAHGTAAVVDAHHVSYTPAANYNGTDGFSYTVIDGQGGQATGQVAVTVNPVNDPPVAAAGTLNTFDDTPATATLVASDVDLDPLSFAIGALPMHGTLGAVVGNRVTYTPAAGYVGNDAFTFAASDGQATSSATIQITVTRSVCGNGIREGVHEECDDGNATPGDGCESTCKLTCGSGTGADRDVVDPATGRCFVAYDGAQHSYQGAAAMCVAVGGHLPTIASAGEDAAAFAAVRSGDTPWLGGDDIAVEGTFGWLTGEPFGYSHFQAGKPDNAGNADCLRYAADGTWTDAACALGGATGTLCELELATATPVFATGGGGTRALAVADLNGDGYSDIAAVNPANNTVGVLLGDGAGGFAAPVTYATGTGPAAIATGDFDGDGKLDLAVVNATANTVGILRGNGSGGFTAGASVAIASGAAAITAADVDGDGALDLVIAATTTVQVLRGNGSGGFSVLGGVALTAAPAAIAAGDFNHDGKIDLAVTTPAAVLILSATGGGVFGLPVTLAVTTGARGIAVRDFDGDGNADLAVATSAGISVWFGTGSALGAPVSLTAAGAQFVAAGDFDGDGATDLVAVTGNFATLFHGAGRTFTPAGPVVTTGGGGASFVAAASVNGDAATDLVIANATTSTAGIVLGGAGGLGGARALPAGTGSTSTVVGDFNEDGRPDLAVIDPPSSKVFLFLQNAAGALVPGTTISLAAGASPTYAVTADFNRDGHLDLAVVNVAFNGVNILLGTGTGTFGNPINSGAGTQPRRPVVVDLDGDGAPDLVIPSATSNALAILINTGGGRFGRQTDVPAGAGPAAVVAGDFNGDGKKDIAVATTGEATVKLVLGHGDGTFAAATAFPVASAGQSLAAADLDGDGKLDLAVTCTTANSVSFLRGTGTGSFAAATSLAVGGQPSSVVAVDLDGDGKLDLVVGNAATSDVTVLRGSGTGSFGASSLGVGGPTGWVTVADFDHDGHPDIAASSASSVATLLYSPR
ncbi:MAG TPA: Ig-like domain-containing protein [Kofleriaceae bacterium]|nr:Ig-like domain-containing protein [Kofleriaceae bacterium]